MESEGLLVCSQELATGPYREPDESNPHPHTLFLYDHFKIIISSTPWPPKWSLLFRFFN
jgi:hypothetical protein